MHNNSYCTFESIQILNSIRASKDLLLLVYYFYLYVRYLLSEMYQVPYNLRRYNQTCNSSAAAQQCAKAVPP